MYIKSLCILQNIEQIFWCLKHMQPYYFNKIVKQSLDYVNYNKKFNISTMYYDNNYNIELFQMFDKTNIILQPKCIFIPITGSVNLKIDYYNKTKISNYNISEPRMIRHSQNNHIIYSSSKNTLCLFINDYQN